MKRVALLLCLSPIAFAQDINLPHALSNNSVANADQVMSNFNTLRLDANSKNDRLTAIESLIVSNLRNLGIGGGLNQTVQTNNFNGNENTALGFDALRGNTDGYRNTAVGHNALFRNESGALNTAVGYRALEANTVFGNTAVGARSLHRNSTGTYNVAIGLSALSYNETGIGNVAVGSAALQLNTTGEQNVAIGNSSQSASSTGIRNSSVGHGSLLRNETGIGNSGLGWGALLSNVDGDYNTALGYLALNSLDTGSGNTAVGMEAFRYLESGTNNTALGYGAGADDLGSGTLENATAIGYNAKVDASNKVRIGNTAVTVIQGQVAFTSSSDARLKDRITPVSDGLALINDLNPVSYHRTNNSEPDIEMGLLAQEVEATLEKHGLGNSGMVHQPNEDAYMSLRYNDLLAPMIRAIQELDTQHQKEVASLREQLQSQQEELLALVQSQQEQMTMQQEQIAQLQRMVEHQFVAR